MISVLESCAFFLNILLIIKYVKKRDAEIPEKKRKSSEIPNDLEIEYVRLLSKTAKSVKQAIELSTIEIVRIETFHRKFNYH